MKTYRIILVIVAIGLLAFSSLAQNSLTNGLVAYYPFNGDANDASGNGNNGTVIGASLTQDRYGNLNQAYSFNGVNNYISFTGVPTTQTDNWSIIAWVNPASFSQAEIAVGMGYDDGASGNGYSLGININKLYPVFGGIEDIDAGFMFPATNQWYQIAMLRNSGTTSFYVNGVSTPNSNTDTPHIPTAFRIGSNIGYRFFNGAIDDVRIYNRALSSNEIAQLYFSTNETAAPVITVQPINIIVNVGDSASFSVTATGMAPLSYQWLKDGMILPNATNAILTFTNVQPPRIGNYAVAITDIQDSVMSSTASLNISNINSALWQNLVAYYPFNGDANDAEGTNDGIIYGGVALAPDRFGSNDSAYVFNGVDGYIDIGSPAGNEPAYLTEAAWVKIISRETVVEPVSPPLDVVISKRQSTLAIGSGWPDLGFIASGPNTGAGVIAIDADFYESDCIGTTLTQTNVWIFICEVCSNGTYQIYTNGYLENSITDAHPLSSGEDMHLMHCGAFGSYCNGVLDDVRIYNRALSSNDIAQLYASEAPPAPPHVAIGSANLAGVFVVGVNIIDDGAGYTNTPLVRFIGGGGSGAQAFAVVSNGVVVAINVINAGYGYTNPPVAVIDPPFIPSPVLGIASVSILNFSNILVGTNYQLQRFQSTNWINQSTSFNATDGVYTTMVSGSVSSDDYRLAATPVPVQAAAVPQVFNGFVVGAQVINTGSGYITPPNVTIVANVGSNATAVASISGGLVTGITITSAGIGYVNPVTIQIDPPPTSALSPTVTLGVSLYSSSLAPYDNYQIQVKSDIDADWGNLNGGLIIPTNSADRQYIFLTNNVAFFRLQYLP
jgi:Concanavalin A-like lectin/glucanases superfamily/Immunoglobulin domain